MEKRKLDPRRTNRVCMGGCIQRVGPHPVRCVTGLFNQLLDLLDVLSYVADRGELRGEVLHL